MIFLWILGGLLALILFVLFLPLHLTVSYDEELQMYLRVLFVRVDITKRLLSRQKAKPVETESKVSEKPIKQSFGEKVQDVLEYVSVLRRTVVETFAAVRKYVKIKVSRFHLRVSFPDAAKTALVWGILQPATDSLFDVLQHNMHFTSKNAVVYPSFHDEGFAFSAQITVSVRVVRAIQIALTAITTFTQEEEV